MNASITRYGQRYWAVYADGELLAVTLYRKGAQAVAAKLQQLNQHHETTILQETPGEMFPAQLETANHP